MVSSLASPLVSPLALLNLTRTLSRRASPLVSPLVSLLAPADFAKSQSIYIRSADSNIVAAFRSTCSQLFNASYTRSKRDADSAGYISPTLTSNIQAVSFRLSLGAGVALCGGLFISVFLSKMLSCGLVVCEKGRRIAAANRLQRLHLLFSMTLIHASADPAHGKQSSRLPSWLFRVLCAFMFMRDAALDLAASLVGNVWPN